jgi:hypothetical protein
VEENMSHKIRTPKIRYDDGYRSNIVLLTLLAIGYPCFIFYMFGYFYNVYQIIYIDHTGQNITIPSETTALIMTITAIVYVIIQILSVLLIVYDAKKVKAGFAYEKLKFFNSMSWGSQRWGWLTFLLWWFIFPLYLYHRKEIYIINKAAYDKFPIKQEPIEIISRKDAVLAAILIIIIIISLAITSYS